jgi:hypothetical protein
LTGPAPASFPTSVDEICAAWEPVVVLLTARFSGVDIDHTEVLAGCNVDHVIWALIEQIHGLMRATLTPDGIEQVLRTWGAVSLSRGVLRG